MAPRTRTPKTPETPADAPETPAETPAPELVDMDWSTLPAPVAMPTREAPDRISPKVLESVPEPIRMRAEASLAINTTMVAKKAGSTSDRKRVNYHWEVQRVASEAMGVKFKAMLVKYAKYRPADVEIPHRADHSPVGQVTTRACEPTFYVTKEDGTYAEADKSAPGAYLGVRYSVRPFEARSDAARVPGSA